MTPEEGMSLGTQLLRSKCTLCSILIPPLDIMAMYISNCQYKMKSISQDGEVNKQQGETTNKDEVITIPISNDKSSTPVSITIKTFVLDEKNHRPLKYRETR